MKILVQTNLLYLRDWKIVVWRWKLSSPICIWQTYIFARHYLPRIASLEIARVKYGHFWKGTLSVSALWKKMDINEPLRFLLLIWSLECALGAVFPVTCVNIFFIIKHINNTYHTSCVQCYRCVGIIGAVLVGVRTFIGKERATAFKRCIFTLEEMPISSQAINLFLAASLLLLIANLN